MLCTCKSRMLSVMVALCVIASAGFVTGVSAFEGGTGGSGTPYQISTQADLYFAAQAPDMNYILLNDIEVTNLISELPAIGNEGKPFTGTFNGNGFQICFSNGASSGDDHARMFGKIGKSGVVENLQVEGNRYGNAFGGLIADVNEGTIRNCATTGSITGNTNVGGLVGYNAGAIQNCYSKADVICNGKSGGGLVGTSDGGTITNCYVSNTVNGSNECGGLIGTNKSASITSCFYNTDFGSVVGTGMGSDAVVGKGNVEMKAAATYAGWDFANTWVLAEGEDTPYLSAFVGKGTVDNPYKIHNGNEFNALTKFGVGDAGKGKYFELAADLNLKNESVQTLSSVGTTDAPFQGIFDGNGYVIEDLLTYSSTEGYRGLFSILGDSAVVKNVTVGNVSLSGTGVGTIAGKSAGRIENCVVYSGQINATKDAGGIVGQNIYGTVINCRNYASISTTQTGAGGIAGYNNNGRIENCSFNGTAAGQDHSIGGIVGDNSSGTIVNCFALGRVSSGNDEVGGIAGRLYGGSITNCYASTTLYGHSMVGGIVGALIETGSVGGCFFNQDLAGTKVAIGSFGTEECGLGADQMKVASSFAGWDFTGVWQVSPQSDYPTQRPVYGDGTQANPYRIRTAADLSAMRKSGVQSTGQKSYYRIENNIRSNVSDIGSESNPFIGSVDGGGFLIDNSGNTLFQAVGPGGYLGNIHSISGRLANIVTGATIEYCSVEKSNLIGTNNGSTITNCIAYGGGLGDNNVGGFIDQNLNGGVIKNCGTIMRSASVSGGGINIGGFVGNNNNGTIEHCFAINDVRGGNNVGGFAGRNDNNAAIKNCYSVGNASGGSFIGGFAGMNYANIQNCYTVGAVSGSGNTAAFAAVNDGKVNGGYFDKERCALQDGAATGLTTADTKKQASYSGYPFGSGEWMITEGSTTPFLSVSSGGRHITVKDTTSAGVTPPPNTDGGLTDIAGHWAEPLIKDLVARGIVNGYEDGTYKPENPVSKAEFIKLVCQTKRLNKPASDIPYTDVNSSWAKEFIGTVYAMGITQNLNVDATTFGVDNPITRAEAATLLGRIVSPGYTGTTDFTDNDQIPQWAAGPVAATVSKGLIQGNPDGSFAPANGLTRAEAATIISRMIK